MVERGTWPRGGTMAEASWATTWVDIAALVLVYYILGPPYPLYTPFQGVMMHIKKLTRE